jgi:hypothetical protein
MDQNFLLQIFRWPKNVKATLALGTVTMRISTHIITGGCGIQGALDLIEVQGFSCEEVPSKLGRHEIQGAHKLIEVQGFSRE